MLFTAGDDILAAQMIGVVALSKHFGGTSVLDEISFSLCPGERAALVGANGCGKTTLLRIIAGLEAADGGQVALAPDLSLGYLGQEGQLEPGRTLYQEMRQVFFKLEDLEDRLRELEGRLRGVEGARLEKLLQEYSALQASYEHMEPATIDARIGKVLGGLGFRKEDLDKLCQHFSGGWQMRGAMAKVLLKAPDCLLLDEPTNHLDLEAMEWLEEYLLAYKGAVLMVSHDRTFLDKVSSRTIELRNGDIDEYAGNYSFYLEEAETRHELRLKRYKNQQKKLAQERRFIERFRYKASLASRVKSREKMLEKRALELAPEAKAKTVRVKFQQEESSGFEVLRVRGLAKAYGNHRLFRDLSFGVERGDRLAVVGANGSGKTTLLKVLTALELADEGKVYFDEFVRLVSFAQHQAESLDVSRTVLEEVESIAPASVTQTEVRTLLGCFLFSGEDVYKKIEVLSGGEKSRVALAKCVLSASNLLILDEPTNHLDIEARQSLEAALELYEGTIIFVTHDRALMASLANKVLDLSATKKEVFVGSYEDYRRKQKRELQQALSRERAQKKSPPKVNHVLPNALALKPEPGGWKLDALEKKIFSLEEELEDLGEQLARPDLYIRPQEQNKISLRYEAVQRECEKLTALWEEMT